MRTLFRATMMILQLPLWLTAFPALAAGMLDSDDGDRLWLPALGTAATFLVIFDTISYPFAEAWKAIRRS